MLRARARARPNVGLGRVPVPVPRATQSQGESRETVCRVEPNRGVLRRADAEVPLPKAGFCRGGRRAPQRGPLGIGLRPRGLKVAPKVI